MGLFLSGKKTTVEIEIAFLRQTPWAAILEK